MASGCSATCASAQQAAVATGIKGFSGNDDAAKLRQMGQLADTFNKALGNQSDFADKPILLK